MPANDPAGAAVRQGYLSREQLQVLLEKSEEAKPTDTGLLWKFFTETARRAQLPYVVQCQSCGPVPVMSPCRNPSARRHALLGLHEGSVVHVHTDFLKSNFVGIGPKLRKLMDHLVRELQREE